MEGLTRKYENFKKAYAALDRTLAAQAQAQKLDIIDADLKEAISAGVIQHFEIAYETAWKFLKEYLFAFKQVEEASLKAVFRACYTQKILPQVVTDELIELTEARNQTTHIYDQQVAQTVLNSVKNHHDALGKILELVKMPV